MLSYDKTFFDYVNAGASKSARRVAPLILSKLRINSILDVGCGQGAWLSVWKELGVNDVTGIDGKYVDKNRLLIFPKEFIAHDLTETFDLQRRYDLVVSMEVAEHLPSSCSQNFISSLVAHGELVLFSAAPRGQGGHNHINEQDYDYWRKLFARHSYVPIDYLRPQLVDKTEVEPWYRYNAILYASAECFPKLPKSVRFWRVEDGTRIKDLSPLSYKLRKSLVRLLPVSTMTRIAQLKEIFSVKNGL